jgi:hypothetical protein
VADVADDAGRPSAIVPSNEPSRATSEVVAEYERAKRQVLNDFASNIGMGLFLTLVAAGYVWGQVPLRFRVQFQPWSSAGARSRWHAQVTEFLGISPSNMLFIAAAVLALNASINIALAIPERLPKDASLAERVQATQWRDNMRIISSLAGVVLIPLTCAAALTNGKQEGGATAGAVILVLFANYLAASITSTTKSATEGARDLDATNRFLERIDALLATYQGWNGPKRRIRFLRWRHRKSHKREAPTEPGLASGQQTVARTCGAALIIGAGQTALLLGAIVAGRAITGARSPRPASVPAELLGSIEVTGFFAIIVVLVCHTAMARWIELRPGRLWVRWRGSIVIRLIWLASGLLLVSVSGGDIGGRIAVAFLFLAPVPTWILLWASRPPREPARLVAWLTAGVWATGRRSLVRTRPRFEKRRMELVELTRPS